MGRPKRDIDEDRVAELAFDGLPTQTIATLIGVDESIIRRRFADIIAKKRAERRQAILKAQFEAAVVDQNPTMLVWLGKTELGQAEPVQATNVRKITVEYRDNADDHLADAPQGAEADSGGSGPV